MKYSEKRRRNVAKVFAFILIAAMILSSAYYIALIFANDRALSALAVYGADAQPASSTAEIPDDSDALERLAGLESLIHLIHDYYKDDVSYDDLVNAAYSGVVDSLEDPWSVYYPTAKEAESFYQSVDQQYCGIGVAMTQDDNGCLIKAVNPKGGAYDAGMRAGGYIVKVDGVSVAGLTLNEISEKIRGKEGTSVLVTVMENGVEKNYSIIRRQVKAVSVESCMLENNIGYIGLSGFASDTAEEFTVAKLSLLSQGANSLIIDVRDNGGGYWSTAVDIADDFLEKGVITRSYYRGIEILVEEATPDANRKVPMVLLVNDGTASSAEIFAAALQDNGAAVLVGTKTYGKGVAQIVQDLEYDDYVKLSIYYFKTPNGKDIDHVGITPDYIVSSFNFTAEEAAVIREGVVDMAENRKYYKGEVGLNVLAAQQRLYYLGYDVDINGYMDDKTVAAIKAFQPTFGGCPYGGLDFCTQKAICASFEALFTESTEDRQLAKAVEILTKAEIK